VLILASGTLTRGGWGWELIAREDEAHAAQMAEQIAAKHLAQGYREAPAPTELRRPGKKKWTDCLISAIGRSSVSAVHAALARGADVSARNVQGWLPLSHAVHRDSPNLEIVRALVLHGAPLDAGNGEALELAARHDLGAVRLLLENGAVLRPSLLCEAVMGHQIDVIDELVARGLDPSAANLGGEPAWHLVVEGRLREGAPVAEALLRHGTAVNLQDREGNTALHRVVRGSRAEWIPWLLERGADPMLRNKKGQAPLDLAATDAVRVALGA